MKLRWAHLHWHIETVAKTRKAQRSKKVDPRQTRRPSPAHTADILIPNGRPEGLVSLNNKAINALPYTHSPLPRPRRRHPNAANAPVSLPRAAKTKESASMALPCMHKTTHSYYHLGFAMPGCMNVQYGSFLPVTCFPGARGAITWSTLDTVMRRALVWPVF